MAQAAKPVISQEKKIDITAHFAEARRLRQQARKGTEGESDEFEDDSDEDSQAD